MYESSIYDKIRADTKEIGTQIREDIQNSEHGTLKLAALDTLPIMLG